MGCGSSKGTAAATLKNAPQKTALPADTYGKHSNVTYQMTNQNRGTPNGEQLPPPRPPDQTLEQLLAGKGEDMKRMDMHANQVSFDSATKQNLVDFTENSLIPKDKIVETETVEIIERSPPPTQNHNQNVENPTRQTPTKPTQPNSQPLQDEVTVKGSLATSAALSLLGAKQDNAQDAELLLEKYKRDTEKTKNLMLVDKMRHNITLQDKLAKRREMKRRAAVAQGTVTAVGGGVDDEVSAKQQRTGHQLGDEAVSASASQDRASDSARAEDAFVIGQVEAGQDKHAVIMAEAAPLPAAPETRKEAIYGHDDNIELFKDLEDFAVNMEQISSPATTFAILMKNLLISQLSDLEKVRILFHWITKQDLNSIVFPNNIDEDTPMGFLFAIKRDSKTYAELFSRLCSAAGLHAKVIIGYLKGIGYFPDYKFTGAADPFRGSWNAVLINGQWRLIDTHWGARHVLEDDDALNFQRKTVYKYEEHYFLTNPDHLIITHFPDEEDWQLLREPVTLERFQDTVKVWPLHHKLRLSLHSHQHGVITAPQDGAVEIRIKTSEFARRDAELKCDFMTKRKERQVGQISLACCTFHYTEGEFQVFQVHCPAPGEYILKIFALSQRFSDEDLFTNVALYQINCAKYKPAKQAPKDPLNVQPSELNGPFPEVTQPWGPPTGRKAAYLLPMSHKGPIVNCDKRGEATLVMQQLNNERLYFLQNLHEADSRPNDSAHQPLADRAVHFFTTARNGQKVVVFRVRTPQKGNYSLNLYVNSKSGDTFNCFCNYFVVSQAQSQPSPAFPSVPNGSLGENNESCKAQGISLKTGPMHVLKNDATLLQDYGNGWIGLNDSNEAFVSFDHLEPMSVIAELQGQSGVDLSRNIIVSDTGRRTVIVIRPPKEKSDTPEYALKLYGAPASQSTGIPSILNALVVASRKDPKLFPVGPTKRWGSSPFQSTNWVTVLSVLNTAPLYDTDKDRDGQDPVPCREYSGGKNIVILLAMKQHMVLNPILSLTDISGNTQQLQDDLCFFTKTSPSHAEMHLHIPKPGDYSLVIYGSPKSSGETQLFPQYYMLVRAASASSGPPMPRAFQIWNSGTVTLHGPVSKFLKRNVVNSVKVTLADTSEDGTAKAFTSVLLLTEKSSQVKPNHVNDATCTYEWDYLPEAGENLVSLVAQRLPEDSALSYVLQFEVAE